MRGSASCGRHPFGAGRTSPAASGSSTTRVAVAATRSQRARVCRRTITAPATADDQAAAGHEQLDGDEPARPWRRRCWPAAGRRRGRRRRVVAGAAAGSRRGRRPVGGSRGAVGGQAVERPAAAPRSAPASGRARREHAGVGDRRRPRCVRRACPSAWPGRRRKPGPPWSPRRRSPPGHWPVVVRLVAVRAARPWRRSRVSTWPTSWARSASVDDDADQRGRPRERDDDGDSSRVRSDQRDGCSEAPAATTGAAHGAHAAGLSTYPAPRSVWIIGLAPGVDLLAQVGDVQLDDVGLAAEVVVPHPVQDLRLRQHPLGVAHEVAQQLELRGGQPKSSPPRRHLVAVLVQRQVADDEQARRRRTAAAACGAAGRGAGRRPPRG